MRTNVRTAGLALLEALEPRLLKCVRKERLRQIAGILRLEPPGDAQVLVEGLPVALHEIAKGFASSLGIGVADPLDDGVPRGGKPMGVRHVLDT